VRRAFSTLPKDAQRVLRALIAEWLDDVQAHHPDLEAELLTQGIGEGATVESIIKLIEAGLFVMEIDDSDPERYGVRIYPAVAFS
jgi:hypothetical protein